MKITLKKKKISGGKISLFIEYYKGKTIDSNGKSKHNREFEYLKMYLIEKPKTTAEKQQNKEILSKAEGILFIRNSDYVQGKFKLKKSSNIKITFIDYFKKKMEERYESKGNYDNWNACYKHLLSFHLNSILLEDIDIEFVKIPAPTRL